MASKEDRKPARGAEHGADLGAAYAQGRPVRDRWMGDLIRKTSGRQPSTQTAPDLAPPPEQLPPRLNERLEQAVRWGLQERDFVGYEASLSHRATFGEYLAWARQRCGLSPEDLSERAELSAREIQELERDSVSPLDVDPEKMARLSRALDASIWTMMERLRPSANGKASAAAAILAPGTRECDSVWSTDGLRAREPFERVSMKSEDSPVQLRDDWNNYRQALYRAWRGLTHG